MSAPADAMGSRVIAARGKSHGVAPKPGGMGVHDVSTHRVCVPRQARIFSRAVSRAARESNPQPADP